MKYLLLLMFIAPLATADFLTRDNGQVCNIPDGYNAGPFDIVYNIYGIAGNSCTFPGKPFIDRVNEGLQCLVDQEPKKDEECDKGLVVSPSFGDCGG